MELHECIHVHGKLTFILLSYLLCLRKSSIATEKRILWRLVPLWFLFVGAVCSGSRIFVYPIDYYCFCSFLTLQRMYIWQRYSQIKQCNKTPPVQSEQDVEKMNLFGTVLRQTTFPEIILRHICCRSWSRDLQLRDYMIGHFGAIDTCIRHVNEPIT